VKQAIVRNASCIGEKWVMARIALGITLAILGTLAAVLLHDRQAAAPAPAAAGQQEMIGRLDRLERAIIQLGASAKPEQPTGPAPEVITPPLPRPQDDARESAIRTGNEIVESAVGAARWTFDDAAALAAATALPDGGARDGLFVRVSAAIDADQVRVGRATLRF
jgi:hypothetical protein